MQKWPLDLGQNCEPKQTSIIYPACGIVLLAPRKWAKKGEKSMEGAGQEGYLKQTFSVSPGPLPYPVEAREAMKPSPTGPGMQRRKWLLRGLPGVKHGLPALAAL